MRIADLPATTLEKLKTYRYDRILEKHEGPEDWAAVLEYYSPDFLTINGYNVLLPVTEEERPNIKVLRCIASADGKTLTIFLKDMTHVQDPDDEFFMAGRVAICDKFANENFYLAIVYHEWFIVDNNKPHAK